MGYVHSYACIVQIDKTETLAIGIILKDLNLFTDYTQLQFVQVIWKRNSNLPRLSFEPKYFLSRVWYYIQHGS